jgi:ABC-type uncharacterized transport system involved in gliding motility auxiliary subunit
MNNPYKLLTQGMLFAGLLALVVGLAGYLLRGGLDNISKILLIVGAALVVGYLVASPEVVFGAVQSRGFKYGGNTLAMSLLFILIIGAGNWFTNTHSQNFDLTRDKLHTLTAQTEQILKNIRQDVKVTAFFRTGDFDENQAKELLAQYASRSPLIQYRFVDPDKDPATARQFGIVSYGTTVFQSGNNRKDVPSVGEQEFTSAILAVTSTERRKVYFVVGNGQPDPNNAEQQGFHDALLALQQNNYVTDTLDATAAAVPDDAAAVILTAGNKPLLDGQKAALSAYLAKGGKMLIASAGFAETDLNELVKPYGLEFLQGLTIDPASSLAQSPQVPAVARFAVPGGNDIVKDVAVTLFPVSSGIQISQPAPQGITITPIARSSDQSWLVNRKEPSEWGFRQGDTRGPINLLVTAEGTLPQAAASAPAGPSASPTPLAGLASPGAIATPPPASGSPAASAAASAKPGAQPTQTPSPVPSVTGADVNLKGGTRIVAVAATRWMDDQFLNVPQAGNRELFLNAINHLVGNQALVTIPAKNAQAGQVTLLGSDANLIFFTTVLFIPLAVLVLGGVVWWSRR